MGIKETEDGIWLVTFMDYDLGYFDLESEKLEPLGYPMYRTPGNWGALQDVFRNPTDDFKNEILTFNSFLKGIDLVNLLQS